MRFASTCFLVALGLGVAAATSGCRRPKTPEVPEVWDEDAAPERTEALGNLAPPWPAPARTQLDNGLMTFWLHEPEAPALHVRLMIPLAAETSSEAQAVVVELLRSELRRRLARRGVVLSVEHRPGRVEMGVHGRGADRSAVFSALAAVLGDDVQRPALTAARTRLLKRLEPADSEELATTTLVAQLAGSGNGGRVEAGAASALSNETLVKAWNDLLDPRRCVVVVHAGHPAAEAGRSLASLSQRWTTSARGKPTNNALARLRQPMKPTDGGKHLLGESSSPLTFVEGKARGGPVLVLGRKIPTPKSADRSLARLAQRLVQEELDIRLTVSGEEALIMVVVPLSGRAADETAQKTVEELSELSAARQPRQRLFQAAQLWLGARVVQASLDGEDWTALWSESVDLASKDDTITAALARDAETMLSVDPDQLVAWQQQWLDPRGGKPGWSWVVAGGDRKVQRQLARVAPIQSLRAPGS